MIHEATRKNTKTLKPFVFFRVCSWIVSLPKRINQQRLDA
jgi:hypothetical protein